MKYFDWDWSKNQRLKLERDIGFESILEAIFIGNLLDVINHTNPKKYPNQKMYVVKVDDYVYLVPFVYDKEKIFLKTIYPSRKMTEKYLIKRRK